MTQEQKNNLQELRDSYLSKINDLSIDFVNDHALSDDSYISDSFTEYADGAVSVYYTDQHNYYVEHSEECESALLELYDPQSIADIIKNEGLYHLNCKAGAIGAYCENERQLYEDEDNILKALIVDYCLNCDIYLTEEQIEEIALNSFERWGDYADQVNELIKED